MMPTASPRQRRGKTQQHLDICVSVRAQHLDAFQIYVYFKSIKIQSQF